MKQNPYQHLAGRLNALPNGFPSTPDGVELRLLARLFTPEEAALAAELRLALETPAEIARRLGEAGWEIPDEPALQNRLKVMARKGLIAAGRSEGGLGFAIMPFVVGFYEAQNGRLDAELAQLFEDYYRQAFREVLTIKPGFHRVIPVEESVHVDLEIRPYESAGEIVRSAKAWGVIDCICRQQKALVGEPCPHPLDVCMVLSRRPGVFDNSSDIRALTLEGALATLERAARAGLVHSVSNVREEITYICNCCTCACGILRGVVELGRADVVAHSPFINRVEMDRCIGCEACLSLCQFGALSLQEGVVKFQAARCSGCGLCIPACPEAALGLVRRSPGEILPVPDRETDWRALRAAARGIDPVQT